MTTTRQYYTLYYERRNKLTISREPRINFMLCYSQLIFKTMTEQEKLIAKVFDKSVEALGLMT
jgi:hypothetical protein